MKQRKTPMRMCVACREMKPKNTLMRIAKNADGTVSVDATGKAPGRGAYLCGEAKCLEACIKRKALNRVFKKDAGEAVYGRIKEMLEAIEKP